MKLWAIDPDLTEKRGELVFRHRCPEYGNLILSNSQCGIYPPDMFDDDPDYDDPLGCPWCGNIPPQD